MPLDQMTHRPVPSQQTWFVRNRKTLIGLGMAIFVCSIASEVYSGVREGLRRRAFAREMQEFGAMVVNAGDDPAKVRQVIAWIEPRRRHLSSSVGDQVRRAIFDMTVEVAEARLEYVEGVDKSEFGRLLAPARLAQDTDLSESRRILATVRGAAAAFRARFTSAYQTAEARMKTVPFANEDRQAYEKGTARREAQAAAELSWKYEDQMLAEYDAIIDLLGDRRRDWSIRDSRFHMPDETLRAKLDYRLKTIDDIAAAQEQALREYHDSMRKRLNLPE